MDCGQPYQRILVGVDGSDASLEALRQAHRQTFIRAWCADIRATR